MKFGIFYVLFSILFGFLMIGFSCNRGKTQPTTPTVQKNKRSLPLLVRPEKVRELPSHPFNPFPARRENGVENLHGQAVYDPYRWLEDASRPDVQEWLMWQNAYARQFLSQLPNREAMTQRLAELSYVDWIGPPVRKGTRYFFSRRHADKEKNIGGLLVGATMVQRPDVFQAVSCHVPLLDMVRYHLFGSKKTWISEDGSADDPQQFQFLFAYSPYHHVKEGTRYPALLMMTADSDDRVDPMHARKFTAAIQHASASTNPVLLRVETQAGHGGGDMIKKRIESTVDEFSFLFHQLGMHFSGGQP